MYSEILRQRTFTPKTPLIMKDESAFTVQALRLWNDLPVEIRSAESVNSFKSLLKTYFYCRAFPDFT